jgi:hypothetical protein
MKRPVKHAQLACNILHDGLCFGNLRSLCHKKSPLYDPQKQHEAAGSRPQLHNYWHCSPMPDNTQLEQLEQASTSCAVQTDRHLTPAQCRASMHRTCTCICHRGAVAVAAPDVPCHHDVHACKGEAQSLRAKHVCLVDGMHQHTDGMHQHTELAQSHLSAACAWCVAASNNHLAVDAASDCTSVCKNCILFDMNKALKVH